MMIQVMLFSQNKCCACVSNYPHRFAELLDKKSTAHDQSLAQLLALGYPLPLASGALKISKGDYKAALDYLLSKSMSSAKVNPSGESPQRGRGRGRGRGTGRGRGRSDPNDGDDPYFDPVSCAYISFDH